MEERTDEELLNEYHRVVVRVVSMRREGTQLNVARRERDDLRAELLRRMSAAREE